MSLPDTKLAVTTWLAAHTGLPTGVTVAGATTDTLASDVPYVAVYRPPSPPPAMWARWDVALINVQAWAATEAEARSVAADAHSVLHLLPGHSSAGVHVMEVTDVTGIGQVPDPGYPDLHRQVFTVRVKARVGD